MGLRSAVLTHWSHAAEVLGAGIGAVHPSQRPTARSRCPVSAGQLTAAEGEVDPLGDIAGQFDRPVVGGPGLGAPSEPAQQVGSGGAEGVVIARRSAMGSYRPPPATVNSSRR